MKPLLRHSGLLASSSHHSRSVCPRSAHLSRHHGVNGQCRRSIATHADPLQSSAVSILRSSVDTSSAEFRENAQEMEQCIAGMEELHTKITEGGPKKNRDKHLARGKMLPRDRITALIDPGTQFLELSPLAGHEMYPGEDVPAGGIITGIGTVEGLKVMIVANDSTVKGGTYYPITVKKHLRAQAIAQENRLPCIYLVDSGGANLPHQADVFPDREHFGRIFYNQAKMSSLSIPQLSLVLGPCTAGGAYVPSMSDESIIVRSQAHIFLAGPPLVRAATGEVVTAEDLGGGEMHCTTSGVTDHLAEDDAHAIVLARRAATCWNYPRPPLLPTSYAAPLYDPAELRGLLSLSLRRPIPAHEILARLVDGSRFSEFKPLFGTTLVTGFARILGHAVGILCSNGPLLSSSTLKATHFIQLCEARRLPLLFLQNISGFMVGAAAEHGGIAKHGSQLVTAVACATVPKFTVVMGGSYGAGNYGMCGRAFAPRLLVTWPGGRTGVMGAEQVAGVMGEVGKSKVDGLRERIERETRAVYGSARGWDDGVVLPERTRAVVGMGLAVAKAGEAVERERAGQGGPFGVFRM